MRGTRRLLPLICDFRYPEADGLHLPLKQERASKTDHKNNCDAFFRPNYSIPEISAQGFAGSIPRWLSQWRCWEILSTVILHITQVSNETAEIGGSSAGSLPK